MEKASFQKCKSMKIMWCVWSWSSNSLPFFWNSFQRILVIIYKHDFFSLLCCAVLCCAWYLKILEKTKQIVVIKAKKKTHSHSFLCCCWFFFSITLYLSLKLTVCTWNIKETRNEWNRVECSVFLLLLKNKCNKLTIFKAKSSIFRFI